ncbi:SDR family NAD(P)-dependent oxidoreductase [Flavobacterium microcysteis]|uniref:SDR family NAD(P)-dependent oxidoreductase n=1 Tax=Flavobacterium microcysteis TaxID=2596891 RepID=A0A501Q1V1_9FLAO|nr:SDR family NAD(P)-dependent oxidoreductase [Flavobacterium microcysteis]TPD65911.1 SDR family NAD(P)-dependent oxidoreductase [Flavobacterium microcysteis]
MKKAIIIGATSGIGKELAKILSKEGYKVGLSGRRNQLLEAIQSENPQTFEILQLDVVEIETLQEKLDDLVDKLGGLDLLVISSGTGDLNPMLDFNIEKITIDTNITGFTFVADWAFRYFEKQHSGHLVGITSIAGLRGNRIAPSYNATKSYQINYLEGLRQKARKSKQDITVTDIRPGFVATDMAKGEGQFWVATPEKAARQIFAAICRKKRTAYITKRWGLIALLLKILPKRMYERM